MFNFFVEKFTCAWEGKGTTPGVININKGGKISPENLTLGFLPKVRMALHLNVFRTFR